jgi:predicted Fe-S protein YdhL (DUF1289 family)
LEPDAQQGLQKKAIHAILVFVGKIKKIVRKRSLKEKSDQEDWMLLTPEERIEVIEKLRRQYYGREEFIANKRAVGRKKDSAKSKIEGAQKHKRVNPRILAKRKSVLSIF